MTKAQQVGQAGILAAKKAGEGPQVRGPAADLLLLATGRAAGLSGVSGPGAAEAAAVAVTG